MCTNKFGVKTQRRSFIVHDNDHEDDKGRCPICNSRIDEYGYCACGGNLGVSWLIQLYRLKMLLDYIHQYKMTYSQAIILSVSANLNIKKKLAGNRMPAILMVSQKLILKYKTKIDTEKWACILQKMIQRNKANITYQHPNTRYIRLDL
jgi:hypothetical protein